MVDRVLVVTSDDVFDAPGNIGSGRRDTLAIELSAPLDRFGFNGAHLRSSMLWRTSRVIDPVTGASRPISEEKPVEASIELNQDLPALRMNWGIEFEHIGERKTKYRYDEVSAGNRRARAGRCSRSAASANAGECAAKRPICSAAISMSPATSTMARARTYPVEEIERRKRDTPGYFSLTFRRSMGG